MHKGDDPMSVMVADQEFVLHRFTVDDLQPMVAAGVIADDARVELFDGALIEMPPISWDHASVVNTLARLFIETFREVAYTSVQGPVLIGRHTLFQPDLALVQRDAGRRGSSIPNGYEIYVVIEVALSSLAFDRGAKRRLYARGAVREYWVVDVAGRIVEVARQPDGDAFRSIETYRLGDTIATAFGCTIAVSEIFT